MKVHAHHDRACDQGSVGLGFHLNPSDLTLRQTPFGLVVSLDGCLPAGAIGGPALPSTTLRVAVPAGTWPLDVEIQAEHWIPVTEEPVFVAPAQPLRPAVEGRG